LNTSATAYRGLPSAAVSTEAVVAPRPRTTAFGQDVPLRHRRSKTNRGQPRHPHTGLGSGLELGCPGGPWFDKEPQLPGGESWINRTSAVAAAICSSPAPSIANALSGGRSSGLVHDPGKRRERSTQAASRERPVCCNHPASVGRATSTLGRLPICRCRARTSFSLNTPRPVLPRRTS
jgi:hypothetical protein